MRPPPAGEAGQPLPSSSSSSSVHPQASAPTPVPSTPIVAYPSDSRPPEILGFECGTFSSVRSVVRTPFSFSNFYKIKDADCLYSRCYEEDIWIEVAKYLEGKDLVKLGMANRWFNRLIMEESIWKYASLRDLQVPPPRQVSFKWIHIYTSAFDGSHSYIFRQKEKHIDWMRIGALFFESSVVLLSEKLVLPKKLPKNGDDPQSFIESCGVRLLTNVKTGIWIADLQLVRCPVCNLHTCDGTMQILDTRHVELFLEEDYRNGTWEYKDIGEHKIEKPSDAATGCIIDIKHFRSPCTASNHYHPPLLPFQLDPDGDYRDMTFFRVVQRYWTRNHGLDSPMIGSPKQGYALMLLLSTPISSQMRGSM